VSPAGARARISVIAAVAENGVIGAGDALPWRLPDDLRRFRALTWGHTLVMGRKTFESIGRALPGRSTIVVSHRPGYRPEGALAAPSVAAALELGRAQESGSEAPEVFIGGGGEIYRQTLGLADRMYLTRIHRAFEGDACFPAFAAAEWELAEAVPGSAAASENGAAGAAGEHREPPLAWTFLTYDRRTAPR
jgi:dihydrofolate reductase